MVSEKTPAGESSEWDAMGPRQTASAPAGASAPARTRDRRGFFGRFFSVVMCCTTPEEELNEKAPARPPPASRASAKAPAEKTDKPAEPAIDRPPTAVDRKENVAESSAAGAAAGAAAAPAYGDSSRDDAASTSSSSSAYSSSSEKLMGNYGPSVGGDDPTASITRQPTLRVGEAGVDKNVYANDIITHDPRAPSTGGPRQDPTLDPAEAEIINNGRLEIYHPLQPDQVTEYGAVGAGADEDVDVLNGVAAADVTGRRSLLAPVSEELRGRKCLVLDLDETLVHSSFKYIQQADFVIPVEIETQSHNVYVIKRPGVDAFMKRVGELYEVVVFTASLSKYGDPLLDQLDIHKVVHHRLFRESCYNHQGNFVKDLSQLGRPLNEIIILDNSPASYIFHPQHAVPISSWFSDVHDNELLDLVPFLEDLSGRDVQDVSVVLDIAVP
ncbi:uncharacterized protein V1510DRAFT_427839 [Dipodascopsis tothii]|uniref:uncharacterized protein n=1 Tax=Dipodascopsis tothii TaxID=44089 RepID=UPI0034CFAD77